MKSQQIPRKFKTINLNTSNSSNIPSYTNYIADLSDHYITYDNAFISNMSSQDCLLILNGSQVQPLPLGTQISINRKFISITIKNIGSSEILKDELRINYGYTSTKNDFINKSLSVGRLFL